MSAIIVYFIELKSRIIRLIADILNFYPKNMKEQKIGKWFIVISVLLILWLFVYFWIRNNWVNIDECYFNDCNLFIGNEELFDDAYDTWSYGFVVDDFPEYLSAWKYTDLKIRVVKNWETFKNFSGTVLLWLVDESGNFLDPDYWSTTDYWFIDFYPEYQWIKNFVNWLKIDKTWSYILMLQSLFDGWCSWSLNVVVHDK